MMTNNVDQPFAGKLGTSIDTADPQSYLRLHMRAVGAQSKLLGKVDTLERDDVTGHLSALTIRHGLRGNKVTSVPAHRVKWVNSDSVVLDFSRAAFQRIPAARGR